LFNVNAQLRQGFAIWRAADKANQNQDDERSLEQTNFLPAPMEALD
jgi:hypothetical protein